MGKIHTPRRSLRSVRSSPVSATPSKPASSHVRNARRVTGDALAPPSSPSGPPADDPHRLHHPKNDRLCGDKLRSWAEELIAHLTSGKKSDKEHGAVLISSFISSNRQRLEDVLLAAGGEEWGFDCETTGQNTDRLSQSDLVQVLTDVIRALTPLVVDDEADVRVFATQALSDLSGMSGSIANHLIDLDVMASIEAALVKNRNSICRVTGEGKDRRRNEHCFSLLCDCLIQLCSRSGKAVHLFNNTSIPSILMSTIADGSDGNNITNGVASAEVILTTIEKNQVPGVAEKPFLSALVRAINCLPVEASEEKDDKLLTAAGEEHQVLHYISLLCLLALSLVEPAFSSDDSQSDLCHEGSPSSRRLPISEAEVDTLRKLLLSKISAILGKDFSTDLSCLLRLLEAGEVFTLLQKGQLDDSQSSDFSEFNSKSSSVIDLLKAMTVGVEAFVKMINWETCDSSDDEEDGDEDWEDVDDECDFSDSGNHVKELSVLKKEAEAVTENRRHDEKVRLWQNASSGTDAMASRSTTSTAFFTLPVAGSLAQTGLDDGMMLSSWRDSWSDSRKSASTLMDLLNETMKMVIRLLTTSLLSHEERMIMKKVPVGAEILDNLLAMQINILISIAAYGEQLPGVMSRDDDAQTIAEAMFSLIHCHSQNFVHREHGKDEEMSRADMMSRNEYRPNEAVETTRTAMNAGGNEHRRKSATRSLEGSAGREREEDADTQVIRGCVYAFRSLIERGLFDPSSDQLKFFAGLIQRKWGEDHSIRIACIKILGAFACRTSDVTSIGTISNLLMDLMEESQILPPHDGEEGEAAEVPPDTLFHRECDGSASEPANLSSALTDPVKTWEEAGAGGKTATETLAANPPAAVASTTSAIRNKKAGAFNLLIRAEILDNLMDMFSEDSKTDQILIRNNLLTRFVSQEKLFSGLVKRFQSDRKKQTESSTTGRTAGESIHHTVLNTTHSRSEKVCEMNRQELAVIQTVAYNFKRFIRYKAKMLRRSLKTKMDKNSTSSF